MRPDRGNPVLHPSKWNNHLCWLALMLLLAAAGCVSSAPLLTARRAVNAAKKGKLTQFQSQLTDRARSTIGTEQGMDAIRQKLAHYTGLSVGQALLVSSKQGDQGYGHIGDVLRTYKAIVAGSQRKGAPPEAIYTFFLKCRISYEEFHHDEVSESCTTTIDANGIPWTNCSGGSPAYDSIDYCESCAVARIESSAE
ncbi:MAG TPA: hypothetical protein VN380_22665 [Thermoanaerobaculia bacterium]|nr:hypothetical protein [Thermoanaerobaculia bacterium]